jgi:hypothetical protein
VLAAHRGTADAAGTDWKAATYQYIQDQIQEGIAMTVLRMCELGQISRAGLYRFDPDQERREEELDLRDAIQRIALEFPCYGRPRITAELRRQGWAVNHKRVGRILREDNLLCIRRRKFVCTTDSNHSFRVYPNLAGKMELTGVDQLWIADITYIRLEAEFVYLAVVLDAFSRRVIGWALDRTLEAGLAITALKMAFRRRGPVKGLTHHSVLVQREMERVRSPLASIPPLRGGDFRGIRVYRSDVFGEERERRTSALRNIVSMSPPSYPSAWLHPCRARFRFAWQNHCNSHVHAVCCLRCCRCVRASSSLRSRA